MSYEDAPATRMVATRCVACGRPLVDAVSVEAGMGPDCRERHGYYDEAPDEARADANRRVHRLAVGGLLPAEVAAELICVRALGFARLADRLELRLCRIFVEDVDDAVMTVEVPFHPTFSVELRRAVPWARWDGQRWATPSARRSRNAVWRLLRAFFPGSVGRGPKGLFVVAGREPPPGPAQPDLFEGGSP